MNTLNRMLPVLCLALIAVVSGGVFDPIEIDHTIMLLNVQIQLTGAEFTTQDCKELGFIKTQLMCSSCAKLSDFGLEDLQ